VFCDSKRLVELLGAELRARGVTAHLVHASLALELGVNVCDLDRVIQVKALSGLKFSDALPPHLAVATLAARLADLDHAATVLAEPIRF